MITTDIILKLLLAIIASNAAVFSFIEFLIKRHDQLKETPERRALRNVLARNLYLDCKEWLHADVRTADDWEIIHNSFQSYEELGGNGKIHKLYDECKSIPTTE